MDKIIQAFPSIVGGKELIEKARLGKKSSEYSTKCGCRNCNYFYVLIIPKGKSIKEFLDKKKCPNCENAF